MLSVQTVRHLHYTQVCPTLHSFCLLCGLRGHQGGCSTDLEWMAEALSHFEAAADQGVLTQRRHQETAWGFYVSFGTTEEPLYSDLLKMDVLQAHVYSSQLCPRRITLARLWHPAHPNTERCHSNRLEGYDLAKRL